MYKNSDFFYQQDILKKDLENIPVVNLPDKDILKRANKSQNPGINRYTLLNITQTNNKDVLYSTGNCLHYLVISYDEGSERPVMGKSLCIHTHTHKHTYTHIQLNHFAVHLKLHNIVKQLYFNKNKVRTLSTWLTVGWSQAVVSGVFSRKLSTVSENLSLLSEGTISTFYTHTHTRRDHL